MQTEAGDLRTGAGPVDADRGPKGAAAISIDWIGLVRATPDYAACPRSAGAAPG